MHRKLKLVPCKTPDDVSTLLQRLTLESSQGEISGLLTIVIYKGHDYEAHVSGEALENPTFARGAVLTLDDYLRTLVFET